MPNLLTADQIEYLIQFAHPDKMLKWSTTVDERVLATIYGVDVTDYRASRARFASRVREAALDLLKDDPFARRVDKLPFAPKSVVVGLGDSITDDHQSWLEILTDLLLLRRPEEGITVINAGISGDTTSQMITRFLEVVNAKPDWIIAMPGTNDARLHGEKPTKTLVSIEETKKNIAMLRNYAATQTKARWVWMTPATVIEEKIPKHWLLGEGQMMWRNKDLAAIAAVIRRQPEPVVDLQKVFGNPANPKLLMDDGLHPSITGQKEIVRALVTKLISVRQ
jgi:lysophospholipase L1-like esterase